MHAGHMLKISKYLKVIRVLLLVLPSTKATALANILQLYNYKQLQNSVNGTLTLKTWYVVVQTMMAVLPSMNSFANCRALLLLNV